MRLSVSDLQSPQGLGVVGGAWSGAYNSGLGGWAQNLCLADGGLT